MINIHIYFNQMFTFHNNQRLRNSTVVDLNQGRVHATNFDKTSIFVKEANRNDIGVYHCELENLQGIGKSLSEINVDVHCTY